MLVNGEVVEESLRSSSADVPENQSIPATLKVLWLHFPDTA
jgi:hypothetical protein